jgi:hypothetical protein
MNPVCWNSLLARVFHHVYQAEEGSRFSAVAADRNGNADKLLDVQMDLVQQFLETLRMPGELVEKLLSIIDPRNCLVVVELQGVPDWQLTHPHSNGPETIVTTLLIEALRRGTPQVDAASFLRSFCFINTPKHRQRRAMVASLQKRLAMGSGWNVATVDKMQGQVSSMSTLTAMVFHQNIQPHSACSPRQEAECVISLYGYSDTSINVNPAFVYSRNRINVALSRAMCKAILIVSEQMLKLRPSILNDNAAVESGFAMFRHLYSFCREGGAGASMEGQQARLVTLSEKEIDCIQSSYQR